MSQHALPQLDTTVDSQGTSGRGRVCVRVCGVWGGAKRREIAGHEDPRLTEGARLSQLRALDLQADEKGPSQIKLK